MPLIDCFPIFKAKKKKPIVKSASNVCTVLKYPSYMFGLKIT